MTSRFWGASQSALRLVLSGAAGTVFLGTLSLDSTTFTIGTPSNGSILGASGGSTITSSGLPTGFTINSAARTWSYDGTGSATTGTMTLTETLAGATGSPKANSIGYTVQAGADTTAPTLSSPTASSTGQTTATIGVTTNEANGTLYAVVTTSSTAPTAAQVKAGQNNAGSAAVYASSQAISSTGAKTFSATGLTASTTYYSYFMHEDAAANRSTVSSAASFTTSAAGGSLDTTWNTNLTYGGSGNALTVTRPLAATGNQQARALGTKTLPYTGQFTVTMPAGTFRSALGLQPPASPNTNSVGNFANDIGYYGNGSVVYNGGALAFTGPTFGAGDVITCRIVGTLVGFSHDGGTTWLNSFNPVTGANGVDMSAQGMTSCVAIIFDDWDGATETYTVDLSQWT